MPKVMLDPIEAIKQFTEKYYEYESCAHILSLIENFAEEEPKDLTDMTHRALALYSFIRGECQHYSVDNRCVLCEVTE